MHLLVAITSHGFGHAAQVAPVVAELHRRLPELRVTLLSNLPSEFLLSRFPGHCELVREVPDFGLKMHSAIDIDLQESADAYEAVHTDWTATVARAVEQLQAIAPSVVLADVPYVTLAAARNLGIPAVALCSLNWADIYRHYFHDRPRSAEIVRHMQAAYNSALMFLKPEPSMAMTFLDNARPIAPLGCRARRSTAQLRENLRLSSGEVVVLVAPGGVDTRFAVENWPVDSGIHWLVPDAWDSNLPQASKVSQSGLDFSDTLASCDAVLGKCGYGTVTECVINQVPLIYIERSDWPEEPVLADWLHRHQAGVKLPRRALHDGEALIAAVHKALDLRVTACRADGAQEAADLLTPLLDARATA